MRNTWPVRFQRTGIRSYSTTPAGQSRPPLIQIEDATFYRRQPVVSAAENDPTNAPLFPRLNFTFPASNTEKKFWAVVGPSNAGKTTLLEILRGQHLCFPPTARLFPYLSSDEIEVKDHRLRYPGRAIQYVGFSDKERGLSGMGTYLSARYESRREVTDFSVLDYLTGNTQLNAGETETIDEVLLQQVLEELRLKELVYMPVSNLSNGQTRRARIAKALLGRPELLLLDEPFMGLDPQTSISLSDLLGRLAKSDNPRLLLSLRPQDPIPPWINHVLFLGKSLQITHQGNLPLVAKALKDDVQKFKEMPPDATSETLPSFYHEFGRSLDSSIYQVGSKTSFRRDKNESTEKEDFFDDSKRGDPLIEMNGVFVKYGDRVVLGGGYQRVQELTPRFMDKEGLFWRVRRGERWGVFGPNGSGKTTLLSMITSDHPQAYSAPMKLFGRSRLPQPGVPGVSVFELQSRIGHTSPEVHAFFPRSLSVRATLESAYADAPLSRPTGLTAEADRRIDACLRWFQGELNPAAGTNLKLREEMLKPPGSHNERKDYVKEGNAEQYRHEQREYWYDIGTSQAESIEWADKMLFGELTFSAQRVALFLRAIIKCPDLVILDEAFSGLDDFVRDKCLLFLQAGEMERLSPYKRGTKQYSDKGYVSLKRQGKYLHDVAITTGLNSNQALICISHVKEEIPRSVNQWLYLPEAGTGESARLGRIRKHEHIATTDGIWRRIWNIQRKTAD